MIVLQSAAVRWRRQAPPHSAALSAQQAWYNCRPAAVAPSFTLAHSVGSLVDERAEGGHYTQVGGLKRSTQQQCHNTASTELPTKTAHQKAWCS